MTWTPKPSYRLAADPVPAQKLLGAWLSDAPDDLQSVHDLEIEFAKAMGAKHAVYVNSGASAMLLAWFFPIALDPEVIVEKRRAIVPAVSWPSAAQSAIQFGYEPVLCEVTPDRWTLDVADLKRLCEREAPSIVLLAHPLGIGPSREDEDAIREMAEEFGFIIVHDASQAIGCIGSVAEGELQVYSTHENHQLSTLEGGFVCTNADEGAEIMRMLRAHGWVADCSAATRLKLAPSSSDPFKERNAFVLPGFNLRGSELHARLGLLRMKGLPEACRAREANHALYVGRFASSKHFSVQKAQRDNSFASSSFGVLASSREHRSKVLEVLRAKNIETGPIVAGNLAKQQFWRGYYEAKYGKKQTRVFEVADRIHDTGFVLPNHPGLDASDLDFIAETVLAVTP